MGKLSSFKAKDVIKLLEREGFELKRIKGSHYFFVHPETKKVTTVPMHTKDLPKGTLYAILRQAGIDKKDL